MSEEILRRKPLDHPGAIDHARFGGNCILSLQKIIATNTLEGRLFGAAPFYCC
jgi:hypothetical protein